MRLKEAFRYQRYLENMLDDARMELMKRGNFTKVTRTHHRNTADPGILDTWEETAAATEYEAAGLVKMIGLIVMEKHDMTLAINDAKRALPTDLDALIASNKAKRHGIDALTYMLKNARTGVEQESGTDYRFNINGEQVPYKYKVDAEYKDEFDREELQRILHTWRREAEEASSEADELMVIADVNHIPLFDPNGTFDEAFGKAVSYEPDLVF